jgi:hypothetical protein
MRAARAADKRAEAMTRSLGGPAIVLALVLAEVAVGGVLILWAVPLWGNVRTSFWKINGAVLAVTGVLATLAARAPLLDSPGVTGAAQAGVGMLGFFASLNVVSQVVLWVGALKVARAVSIASVPVGFAALVAIALDPAAQSSHAVAAFQLVAGALFAGAATVGLLLGHWYLVDRKLSRAPLARVNLLFCGGAIVAAVAAFLGRGAGGGTAQASLSPLLGAGALASYLAVGLAGLCLTIGVFIRALVKEDSVQAATGLFYLGVIMGLSAEFAAKVRFF